MELSIGPDGTGLAISDLHMSFHVERSNTISENTSEFIIYNAKESTRKEISRKENNIIFDYGYEDEDMGTLFIGNVDTAESFQEGPDWITTIVGAAIQSKNSPLTNSYISFSYAEDTLMTQPLNDIATRLGLAVYGLDNAAVNLANGFAYSGSTRGALKECAQRLKAFDVALYIDNNTIVIYNTGSRISRFSPVFLDYNSGLIRLKDITEKNNQESKNPRRIAFDSIIIPKLQPNGLVTIQNTGKLEGTYLIESLVFDGDNFGGENICSVEAIE